MWRIYYINNNNVKWNNDGDLSIYCRLINIVLYLLFLDYWVLRDIRVNFIGSRIYSLVFRIYILIKEMG